MEETVEQEDLLELRLWIIPATEKREISGCT